MSEIDTYLATVREKLEAAKTAEPAERDELVKSAHGEALRFNWRTDLEEHSSSAGALERQLRDGLIAPQEEQPYFINRAMDALNVLEEDLLEDDVVGACERPDGGVVADGGTTMPHIELPAGGEDLPYIDPTDEEREHARMFYAPEQVPDEGAIPETGYSVHVGVTVETPEWAIDAVRWRLSHTDDPSERNVEALLHEYVQVHETYVTEDGEPVADILLDE